jgi:UDP-glucose 4-epimerase
MRSLIIGGNGFIGSHLVDRLFQTGDQIKILDNNDDKHRGKIPGVEFISGSMEDRSLMIESLDKIDIVYHLASNMVPGTSNLDPASDVRNNLLGTLTLLEAMVRKSVRRIYFFGRNDLR